MKPTLYISWFLGISSFMFGVLKFANPFKSWYAAQIAGSGMGSLSYAAGIAGEIGVGIALVAAMVYRKRLSPRAFALAVSVASAVMAIMMLVTVYVHIQPEVPAEVLPMKIKPPFIPVLFLILAIVNIFSFRKSR